MNDSVMSGGTGKEDGDDPEYNYLADQLDEEKEEFRDDRAVRISSRSHTRIVGYHGDWLLGCVVAMVTGC